MAEQKCTQCGAELATGSSFCTNCGARVDTLSEAQIQEPQVNNTESAPSAAQVDTQQSWQDSPDVTVGDPSQQASPQTPYQPEQPSPVQFGAQVPFQEQYGSQQPYQGQPPYQGQQPYQGQYGQTVYQAPPPQQPATERQGQQPVPGQPPYQGQPPQQPYPAHPTYQVQPPQQPYPAHPTYQYQQPPTEAPKKSRWWIPVVAVLLVAALAVGAWFLFFKKGGRTFANDEEAWHAAEEEDFFGEGTVLGSLRSSANELIESGKIGTGLNLGFVINKLPDSIMTSEVDAVLNVIKDINIKIESRSDLKTEIPTFSHLVALSKQDEDEDAVSLNLYNVNRDFVVSIPEIFPKPLVIKQEALNEMLGDGFGLASVPADLFFNFTSSMNKALDLLTVETTDKMLTELREIYYKYSGEPTRVKDFELQVGSVTEKLDYFEAIIPADQFGAFAKEILTYIRDNEDITSLLNELGENFPEEADQKPLQMFQEKINGLIAQIDDYPDNFAVEFKRILYVDADNNPRGGVFTLTKVGDDTTENQEFTLTSVRARDGEKGAYKLAVNVPGEDVLNFNSEYTEKEDLSTGTFDLNFVNSGYNSQDINLKGSFTDLGLYTKDKTFYPIGELKLNLASLEAAEISGEIVYSGKVEEKSGVPHLLGELLLQVTANNEPLDMGINFDLYQMKDSDISFETELPADYVDVSNQEALEELLNDEAIFMKLIGILNKLGISPADFMN